MQNRDIYLMILGMSLVTYLPRVLPAFLMGRIRLSARVERFLQLIPYTAMTALVFPGVFTVDANPQHRVGIHGKHTGEHQRRHGGIGDQLQKAFNPCTQPDAAH